jgi:Flp pilus assembly protein TadG
MVIVIPALMLILVVVVQFALWAHAAQSVQLAASEGDRAARVLGGSPAAGTAQAQAVLRQSGSDLASSQTSVVVLPGDEVRITVTGTALPLLPGLTLPVSAVLVGPVQEFRGSE